MKLNPCRKCKGKAAPEMWWFNAFFVFCHDCDNATRIHPTEAQAAEAWNRENPEKKGTV
jgi:hypothetical protein